MTKTSLILIHGTFERMEGLEDDFQIFGDYFDLYFYQIKPNGQGEKSLSYHLSDTANTLKFFIEEKGLEKPHLLGYSLGGLVALKLSASGYQNIGRIATLNTKFDWNPFFEKYKRGILEFEFILDELPIISKNDYTRSRSIAELMRKTTFNGLEEELSFIHRDLAKVYSQVLILITIKNPHVSINESEWAANQITRGKYKCIDGGIHNIFEMDSSVLFSELYDYFRLGVVNIRF